MATYDVFLPHMFPLYIYYFFLFGINLLLTLKLYKKWRERKEKVILHLTLVFASLAIAMILLIIGMTEAVITGLFKETYRITLPLAYCLVVLADIFLYLFTVKITNRGQQLLTLNIVIGIALIVMILLPWNYWGNPSVNYEGKLYIRLYTSLFFVGYSIIIYLIIAIICVKTKTHSMDKIAKMGLSLLFWSVICMIGFFIFLMIDNAFIVLTDHPGYTIFIYIAWIFALLFALLSYMSLIMPKWLIKWIQKKK